MLSSKLRISLSQTMQIDSTDISEQLFLNVPQKTKLVPSDTVQGERDANRTLPCRACSPRMQTRCSIHITDTCTYHCHERQFLWFVWVEERRPAYWCSWLPFYPLLDPLSSRLCLWPHRRFFGVWPDVF